MADYTIVVSPNLEPILNKLKKRKPDLYLELSKQMLKIAREPYFGKPMRNVLSGSRRIQIGSSVLLYAIKNSEVHLLDFDHHDKIYKKYE